METWEIVLIIVVLVVLAFYVGVRVGIKGMGMLIIKKIEDGTFWNKSEEGSKNGL